jgi:hypothetical protein
MVARTPSSVMAGHSASEDARKRTLVPAIHDLLSIGKAWMPGTQSSLRSLRKLDCLPGMTTEFVAR